MSLRSSFSVIAASLLLPLVCLAWQDAPGAAGKDAKLTPAEARTKAKSILLDALKELDAAAAEIPKQTSRNRVLADIAVLQARLGDRVGSMTTFQRSRDAIRDNNYLEFRTLAKAHGSAGNADEALKLANAIPDQVDRYRGKDKEFRALVLRESAKALAEAGHVKDALRLVDTIDGQKELAFPRQLVLRANVMSLAKAGKFREALESIATIDGDASKVTALVGQLYSGYTLMDYPHVEGIAAMQLSAGDKAGAKKSADQALTIVRAMPAANQPALLATVACLYARIGEIPAALAIRKELRGNQSQIFATSAIVQAQAALGKIKEARETFKDVMDAKGQLDAVYHLAVGQAQASDHAGARKTFAEVLGIFESLDEKDRDGHFHNLASGQAHVGDVEGALNTVQKHGNKAYVTLANIAYSQSKAGDFVGALQTADRLPLPQGAWWRGNILTSIAHTQAERGDIKGALVWVSQRNSASDRATALLGIASGLAKHATADEN